MNKIQLTSKDYEKGDYEKYIKELTKENMCQLFIDNFGGWSDEVSEKKFFEIVKKGFVKLFFSKNDFVGYVSYGSEKNNDNSYLINDIHVVKFFQRKGCGTIILNYVLNEATKEHIEQLKVFVFKKNISVNFYKKMGFNETQYLEKSDTLVMVKKLII